MTTTATPIENHNVQLVQIIDGQWMNVETTMENIEACFGVRGFEVIGFQDNPRLRPELIGCPIFSKLCGPMWGGRTTDGKAVIRYECAAANDIISA